MLRARLFFNIPLLATLLSAQAVTVVPFTSSDQTFPAASASGEKLLAVREMLLDVRFSDGSHSQVDLVVLFDSAYGTYDWFFAPAVANGAHNVLATSAAHYYAAEDRLVRVWPNGVAIRIWDSTARASSLNDAVSQMLLRVEGSLEQIKGRGTIPREITEISLRQLGFSFYNPTASAMVKFVQVRDISHLGKQWEVEVEAEGGRAKVVLDENYKVLSMTRPTSDPHLKQ